MIEKSNIRQSVVSGTALGSTGKRSSRRFESPRSHSELQELEDSMTGKASRNVSKARRRARPGSNPIKPSNETSDVEPRKPTSLQSQGTNICSSSRPRSFRAMSVSRKNAVMNGSSSRPGTSNSGRSKTKSLLDRVHRSTSCMQPILNEDNETSTTRVERSVSDSNQLLDPSPPRDMSGQQSLGQRKSLKRVPVRILRLQQKAALMIQTAGRRLLARRNHRKLLLKAQYFRYVEERRQRRALVEKERRNFMSKLMIIHGESQNEIRKIQARNNKEKRETEVSIRRKFEGPMVNHEEIQQLETKADEMSEELIELQNEQARLIAEINLTESMASDLEQENEQLQATNKKIMTMFAALNDFASSTLEEKKRLEEEARSYNRFEVQKTRQEIRICSSALMLESAAKDMYRGCMYRHLYQKLKNEHATTAYEEALDIVREVEASLGTGVLSPAKAKLLLERKDNDTGNESEEED